MFKIALRNLISRRLKTIIIGSVITLGSFIAILGSSVIDSITESMRKSISYSVSGDIQIYSSLAKEKLSVIGQEGGNFADIGQITNYKEIKEILKNIPNIKSMVPQGINFAMLNPGNILDIKLAELRKAKGIEAEYLKEHIRSIIRNIDKTYASSLMQISSTNEKELQASLEDIKKALAPDFWKNFDRNRNTSLEFLENKIAPMIFDDTMLYFYYIGTIPDQYTSSFPLVEITKGETIPKGKRGFLFNQEVYEKQIKHKIAVRLDDIKKAIEKDHQLIKDEKKLQDKIKLNTEQVSELYNQLNPEQEKDLKKSLQRFLRLNKTEISDLLASFLNMNDDNFMQRYQYFYDHIADKIILYKIKIGDVFPLKTVTKAGYSSSINMKVYGVFKYKNFEHSPIAGNFNIMDIISFRDLYGFLTAQRRAETKDLEKQMEKNIGKLDMDSNDIEAMFSKKQKSVAIIQKKNDDVFTKTKNDIKKRQNIFEASYTEEEMENDICLNAAILLHDPSRTAETIEEIKKLNDKYKLNINVIDWKASTGILGQFTTVVKTILYVFICIIFVIGIFIIINSMLIATMERVKEIGTMRAIGAQRSYILKLILTETCMLSIIFGAIGIFLGVAVVELFKVVGIPAPTDVFLFLFSGPRLYLGIEVSYITVIFGIITIVSLLSSFYPAYRATRIQPIKAMQRED
jgi:ABC-type lipoprotein release transport system permease subunit